MDPYINSSRKEVSAEKDFYDRIEFESEFNPKPQENKGINVRI
ncbi:hypothetical protein LEP1GSC060_2702 [Leptospira weilii serovar Ranarum str. ICFT]|uniref:Uncharacterized protein n=1 Tax=Leptospira weilii serovar Ranarum str. ICFT TaxID=1218598 RepID=N1WKN8_9LEPT|nr:hypothetical protein LEP1GSC060_2702 [Leptospira weilii serovar Ranarum str. ICFT]